MSDTAGRGTVAIAELVDTCEHMADINRELFEQLGAWVADEPDPALQRWFAVASHRHAWHAELWSERRPKVPLDASARTQEADHPDDRARWYAERLTGLRTELASIESRVDPDLDPSTARVIALVAADLAGLTSSAPT